MAPIASASPIVATHGVRSRTAGHARHAPHVAANPTSVSAATRYAFSRMPSENQPPGSNSRPYIVSASSTDPARNGIQASMQSTSVTSRPPWRRSADGSRSRHGADSR